MVAPQPDPVDSNEHCNDNKTLNDQSNDQIDFHSYNHTNDD